MKGKGVARALYRAERWIRAIERAAIGLAGAMLFVIMLVVVADVVLRYFFSSPLTWSYELISLYLMVGLFFFALSDTLAHDAHVRVDIVYLYLPKRMQHAAEVVAYGLAAPVFAGIVYMAAVRTWEAWQGGEVIAGHIEWPTWLAAMCVPLGVGVLLLRIVLRAVEHGLSVVLGRSVTDVHHAEVPREGGP